MLQYPEDLEQVEQLKSRTLRKKNSIDTRLKASVQEQLSDVQHGMETLNVCIPSHHALPQFLSPCFKRTARNFFASHRLTLFFFSDNHPLTIRPLCT